MVKKNGVGVLFGMFIIAMIAIVLLQSTGDNVNTSTATRTEANHSVTMGGVGINNATLNGKNFEGTVTVSGMKNFSTWGVFTSTNYTVYQTTSEGKQVVKIGVLSNSTGLAFNTVNVTYTYHPEGYVSNSAGRSIMTLVLVIMALGLLITIVVQLFGMERLKAILGVGR